MRKIAHVPMHVRGLLHPERQGKERLMEGDHTCLQGPLCEQAELWLDMTREDVPWCDHDSCLRIIHEDCRACFTEAMDAAEEGWRQYKIQLPYLNRGYYPVDMTELVFEGVVAAPGYGSSYGCRCNHSWLWADRHWYSEDDLRNWVPELTLADVI